MSKKLTTKEFIERSNLIHNNKYDYSESIYINNTTKIKIICDIHGSFLQRSSHHMNGSGCNKCVTRKSKKDKKSFIEECISIHGNIYDYRLSDYNGSHENIIIICKKHGEFLQTPSNHLSGRGCSKCSYEKNRISNYFDTVRLIHNNKYSYFDDYVNLRSKIKISCKDHGIFEQTAKNHMEGQGCPICGSKFGIKENKWLDLLGISRRQIRIGKYIVDGYDEDAKTVYEFNGDFWHGNPKLYNENEINKVLNKTFGELYEKTKKREQYLIDSGYKVISIWENDFDKI